MADTANQASRVALALIAVVALIAALFAVFEEPARAAPTGNCDGVAYSAFTFNFVNGTTISGDNCPGSDYELVSNGSRKKNEAWFPGTGGNAAFPSGPGMQIHVSCSEVFEDGWANNGGQPDQNSDPNWKIANYTISKYKENGEFITRCGEVFVPSTTSTTIEDTTSTTVGETTSTTLEETTSTTAEILGTTITAAPTTTIEVMGTSITAAPSTTVAVEVTEGTLPFTGFESGTTGLFAMLLVGIGLLALAGARASDEEDA